MALEVQLPFYTINSNDLANWLGTLPNSWWVVDGDPVLMSYVNFPCPTEELTAELRRINKPLRVFDPRKESQAHGESIPSEQLAQIADTCNKSRVKTYLFSWEDDDLQWLLAEDPDAAASLGNTGS